MPADRKTNAGMFKVGNPGGPGRPSRYTQEIGDEICDRIAKGESLNKICQDEHMPVKRTVVDWALKVDTPFSTQYARAREISYQLLADEIIEIADTPQLGRERKIKDDGSEEVTESDMVAHRTLRINTRKWMLSKVLPKIYGEKVQNEVTGANGAPLVPILNVNVGRAKS